MTVRTLTSGVAHDELVATVALLQSSTLVKTHLGALIENVGSAVELLRDTFAQTAAAAGQPELFEPIPECDQSAAVQEVASWSDYAYHVSTVLDSAYPDMLRTIFNRPPLLFTEGEPSVLDTVGVAIVGTRKASAHGMRRATRLARELGERGLTIVSGLAAGIDSAAHRAALDVGARTIAVVGTGLTKVYPKENTLLAREIVAKGGALVSQFLPRTAPQSANFPMRNITMSGLSVITVVVEASNTSGARMQARVALQHGRSVFLLQSLVEQHTWAREMVEAGVGGMRARVLRDLDDLTARLDPSFTPRAFAIA
jgi:DNA processing protein